MAASSVSSAHAASSAEPLPVSYLLHQLRAISLPIPIVLVTNCCDTMLALAESAINVWKTLIRWCGYSAEGAYNVVAGLFGEPLYMNLG